MNDPWKVIVPGSIYEMFMDGAISTRLHNGLVGAYSDKFDMFFVDAKDLSLEKILSGLNISKPEDALKIENLGKKSVEDLKTIWPF